LANGEDRYLSRRFNAKVRFERNEIVEYKLGGYVVDGMKKDIILGMPFLMNNNAEIYCKNGLVKIDDMYYRFHNRGLKFEGPDEMLIERFNKVQEKRTEEFNDMLTRLKVENPIIGNIKDVKHEIKLTDTTPVQLKPYKIPLAIRNDFRNQLSVWEQQGVIRRSSSNYASPCYGIAKKNGNIRIVTDYV